MISNTLFKILIAKREVYKARSKKDGSIVALKKILMHNEKDGVRSFDHGQHYQRLIESIPVSYHGPS
jgi:hypothetical protein